MREIPIDNQKPHFQNFSELNGIMWYYLSFKWTLSAKLWTKTNKIVMIMYYWFIAMNGPYKNISHNTLNVVVR